MRSESDCTRWEGPGQLHKSCAKAKFFCVNRHGGTRIKKWLKGARRKGCRWAFGWRRSPNDASAGTLDGPNLHSGCTGLEQTGDCRSSIADCRSENRMKSGLICKNPQPRGERGSKREREWLANQFRTRLWNSSGATLIAPQWLAPGTSQRITAGAVDLISSEWRSGMLPSICPWIRSTGVFVFAAAARGETWFRSNPYFQRE